MNVSESNGAIVIIETDHLMRELFKRWLGDGGYRLLFWNVVGLDPGPSCLDVTPQLLIADVANPHLSHVLIRDLRAQWAAPILLVSGRFSRGVGESRHVAEELGVRMVLPKPFTREELVAAVEESMREAHP